MPEEYCNFNKSTSAYAVTGDFGYWMYCDECNKPIDGEFYYYDEPELYR